MFSLKNMAVDNVCENQQLKLAGCVVVVRAVCCMKGVVSKETVVLRRWGSSVQKFGFINGVDKCKLATVQRF